MTKEQIDQLIDMNCDKISPEYIPTIRERLADADEGIAQAAFAGCKGEVLMMVMASSCADILYVSRYLVTSKNASSME